LRGPEADPRNAGSWQSPLFAPAAAAHGRLLAGGGATDFRSRASAPCGGSAAARWAATAAGRTADSAPHLLTQRIEQMPSVEFAQKSTNSVVDLLAAGTDVTTDSTLGFVQGLSDPGRTSRAGAAS